MKYRVETDGKSHKFILISENVFDQSIIDSINCFALKTRIYKIASYAEINKIDEKEKKCDSLVIEMENN